MPRVLLTAFDPYGPWKENASWLAMVELLSEIPPEPQLATWRIAVDYREAENRIDACLRDVPDFAIHLGQAPGADRLLLEAVALNRREPAGGGRLVPLDPDGPLAYETSLPVDRLAEQLVSAGYPASRSAHAGTYLCNALYYFSLRRIAQRQLPTQALFVHVPLAPRQLLTGTDVPLATSPLPSWPARFTADALLTLLAAMA